MDERTENPKPEVTGVSDEFKVSVVYDSDLGMYQGKLVTPDNETIMTTSKDTSEKASKEILAELKLRLSKSFLHH